MILHLNIRIIHKNFEKVSKCFYSFSIFCFSETSFNVCCNNSNVDNSNYEFLNYVSVHQIRNHYKQGEVPLYIHENFEFKIRNDLVALIVQILNKLVWNFCMKQRRNILFSDVYRQPNSKIEPFVKKLSNKNKSTDKNCQIADISILTSEIKIKMKTSKNFWI